MVTAIPARFISAYEVADRLEYHHDSIKARIRAGDFPSAIKGPQNAWWVDPADLGSFTRGKGLAFWQKVDKTGDCWLWTGSLRKGYGIHGGRIAHRLAYEELVGPIAPGLELDHLCRVPRCVRPEHLEPVTKTENLRRQGASQTHCKHGHEFTPENTYLIKGRYRSCRKCTARLQREYQARKRAAN